jgi:hypothetical protein
VPGAGVVSLRVSKYGYDAAVRQLTVDRDEQVTLEMWQLGQPGAIAGRYTVTFIASPSCTLPPEARQRTYGAVIEEARVYCEPWDLDVTLDGAAFVVGCGGDAGFIGTVDDNTERFEIGDGMAGGYYSLVERVGNMTMHYEGAATGTVSDKKIVTAFDGRVVLRTGTATVAECRAADDAGKQHQRPRRGAKRDRMRRTFPFTKETAGWSSHGSCRSRPRSSPERSTE